MQQGAEGTLAQNGQKILEKGKQGLNWVMFKDKCILALQFREIHFVMWRNLFKRRGKTIDDWIDQSHDLLTVVRQEGGKVYADSIMRDVLRETLNLRYWENTCKLRDIETESCTAGRCRSVRNNICLQLCVARKLSLSFDNSSAIQLQYRMWSAAKGVGMGGA